MRFLLPVMVILLSLVGGCLRCNDATQSTQGLRSGEAGGVCHRTSDCERPLVCVEQECVQPAVVNPLPPSTNKPVLAMPPKRVPRPILVGGCLESCERPEDAVHHFIGHVLRLERDEEVVRSFIDTSLLVHNETRHGDGWAELFLAHRLADRSDSIERWLKEWLKWADLVVDPLDRRYDDAAVKVRFKDQSQYVVDYQRPDLRDDSTMRPLARVWRITMKKRGLEWLVASIDDESKGTRSSP